MDSDIHVIYLEGLPTNTESNVCLARSPRGHPISPPLTLATASMLSFHARGSAPCTHLCLRSNRSARMYIEKTKKRARTNTEMLLEVYRRETDPRIEAVKLVAKRVARRRAGSTLPRRVLVVQQKTAGGAPAAGTLLGGFIVPTRARSDI